MDLRNKNRLYLLARILRLRFASLWTSEWLINTAPLILSDSKGGQSQEDFECKINKWKILFILRYQKTRCSNVSMNDCRAMKSCAQYGLKVAKGFIGLNYEFLQLKIVKNVIAKIWIAQYRIMKWDNNVFSASSDISLLTPARGERSVAESACPPEACQATAWTSEGGNPYEHRKGFTIIEAVLTLVIIATSLTAIFSLQTRVLRTVFGTHNIIEHIIGVRNFVVKNDQEEYYKQGKGIEKKIEDALYSIVYEPKSSKQFPVLNNYKNIVVEKMKLSSKSVFINYDEFVFFRFNPEGKK